MGAAPSNPSTTTSSVGPTRTTTSATAAATVNWKLQDDYLANGNFFSQFNFWDTADPTHGTVQYVNQTVATANNLIRTNGASSVYFGADSSKIAPNGRLSVRLTSKKTYNSGLIIVDAGHVPFGCGTWPAFWTLGPDWPNGGEIDIIEGVNVGTTNLHSMHTAQGCTIQNAPMTGSIQTSDCYVYSPSQASNVGCGINTSNTSSFGQGFNDNNGGVYATRIGQTTVSVWFFGRKSIPADITAGKPTPSTWGLPVAQFSGCDISKFIKQQSIVFTNTFCGDWAGNVWGQSSCASRSSSCASYVQNNPSQFREAYWLINSLKVYQPS